MRDAVLCSEIEFFGVFVLLLMLTNAGKNTRRSRTPDQRYFNALLVLNLVILLCDTAFWWLNGRILFSSPALSVFLSNLLNYAYLLLHMPFAMLWMLYCDYKLHGSRERILRRFLFYSLPTVAVTLLLAVNPFTGWIFHIDATNVYHRGALMPVMVVAAAFYAAGAMLITAVKLLKSKNRRDRTEYHYIFSFPLLPLSAMLVQMFFFGLPLLWVSTVFSLLMIFVRLQNSQIRNDALTGVYNRRYMETHLSSLVTAHEHGFLFAVMLDVDRFKSINDRFGHAAGDEALISTVALLRDCCAYDDFISRLGGDEFLVVGTRRDPGEVSELAERIGDAAERFTEEHRAPYPLSFSIGWAIFGEDGADTAGNLINVADKRMYRVKAAHHLVYSALGETEGL